MIIAVDIETSGLDCTKFVCGCVVKENGVKKVFYKKEEMWEYIIELGKSEHKRGKVLNVYGHNHSYDFHGYANLKDKNIKYYALSPFIVAYEYENKEIIKFLDTFAIFKMSLKKVGKIVNLNKIDTPLELLDENNKEYDFDKIVPYMIRDAEVCLKAVQYVKDKVKEDGINIKRLYTINQIAIGYMINEFKKDEQVKSLFYDKDKGYVKFTKYRNEIHSAYRGGRVEAWQTGIIKNVSYVDFNSLYPYCATKIRFPNMESERKINKPLELIEKKELFNMIGVSRCLIYNEKNELGLMNVRLPKQSYIPKKDKYIIGTWTHLELRKAIEEGYKVIDVEWSVVYDDEYNPYKKIIPKLYKLRKSGSVFDNFFYKMVMNAHLGKMAQKRVNQEMVIDSVEEVDKYIKRNFEIVKGVGLNYMYSKKEVEFKPKKYYCPIIPTLVNAYSRVIMYDNFKKLNPNTLVYTDTDSIIFEGEIPKSIDIGSEMGKFKVESEDEEIIVYGKKTYCIGNEIKISGIRKRGLDPKDFKEGRVVSKKMVTIKTADNVNRAGKFVDEARDLKEQNKNFEVCERILEKEKLYIDSDIEDISFFVDKLFQVIPENE